MRIKLKTPAAGPDWRGSAGQVIDVPDEAGADLLKGGYAEAVDVPSSEDAPDPASSDGGETEPKETATARRKG